MKNIKNIIIIFSLLAAPVAFGCPMHDNMAPSMGAPRSMSGQEMMDEDEAYDADYGFDNDAVFEGGSGAANNSRA